MDALEAGLEVRRWQHAVQMQHLRVVGEGIVGYTGKLTREVDAVLYVVALRNLLRATDLMTRTLDEPLAQRAAAARSEFDQALPAVIDMRDVLEHFDEYMTGSGKLQHPAGTSLTERRRSATAPVQIWHEVRSHEHLVGMKVAEGKVFTLDLNTADETSRKLLNTLDDLLSDQRNTETIRTIKAISDAQRDQAAEAPD